MRYLMLRKLLRQTLNWNSWTTVYWITYRCSKRQLHNLDQYLSRYSFVSLSYQCLNPDTILLAICVNTDTSNQLTNVSNRTQITRLISVNYQRHFTGSDIVCYQLDNSDRMFQWNQITLNTVIKPEFLYQLMYLRFIYYKLKLIYVITISTSLSISHDYYNDVKYYSKDKIGAINMYVIIYIYI